MDQPTSDAQARRNEKRLIAAAMRRERSALRELIDLHKDRLFAFIRRMIPNHHDAEEITQDAFMRAFASLDTFSTEYRFSTWLFTIAYRLCLNSIRRKQSLTGDLDFTTFSDEGSPSPSALAESDDARHMKAIIWDAVDRLSPPQRAAVLLFYQQDRSCQEIAQVLELPVATVKSHLHRARCRLKEMLEPAVADESTGLRILHALAG